MAMQVHVHKRRKKKHFTMLSVLQMFSGGLIASVLAISALILIMKVHYAVEPAFDDVGFVTTSPIMAAFGLATCLVMSFLIPEYIIETARRGLKEETRRQQVEDMPFILVPAMFIRYALLAIVTIVGFIMTSQGRGVSLFLPLALAAITLMFVYFPTETRMRHWVDNDHKLHLT